MEREAPVLQQLIAEKIELRELQLAHGAKLIGESLHRKDFFER